MIRLISPDEFENYKKLRLLGLQSDPKAFLSTFEYEKKLSDNYFLRKIANSTYENIFGFYGFFINNELLGYVQLSNSYLQKKQHIAYLYELFVHPDHREKGIGTKLVQHLIDICKESSKLEYLVLYVNSGNKSSIQLYEKVGFIKKSSIANMVKESPDKYQAELVYVHGL